MIQSNTCTNVQNSKYTKVSVKYLTFSARVFLWSYTTDSESLGNKIFFVFFSHSEWTYTYTIACSSTEDTNSTFCQ